MKVLITGGNGFIGQAVNHALKQADHEALIFDRVYGDDIRDADRVATAVEGMDAVIHLAGVLGTHELFDTPQLAVDVNVTGTLNVLDACRSYSASYVGITMPQVFPSIYTATKVCATRLASAYHHTWGIPVSHVRAFNAYGPGQKHGPGHPQKIVPTFATMAWQGEPIPVWGDGQQTVDLIHVDELARLLVDALRFGDDVTFDGGSGVEHTVEEIALMANVIAKSAAGIEFLPMRRGEQPTKLRAAGDGWDRLDWRPSWDLDLFVDAVRAYKP